jgi:photosynthetic reaction center cytochrome c subunit
MRVKRMLAGTCVGGLAFLLGSAKLWTQPPQPTTGTATSKMAEQVYKNIQVLKGVPADQLIPAMQFITASLGVQCDFCHQESAFEKDDKETKQTARKMMHMMFGINKDNFDGHQEVTCYACHRGEHKPVITPVITSIISAEDGKSDVGEKLRVESIDAILPGADQIVAKYLQAIGRAAAGGTILTLIQKGTLTVGAQHFPVEVLAKAPSKRVTTVHFPGGDSITGVSGDHGWLGSPGHAVHEMSSAEVDAAKMEAEVFFRGDLQRFLKEVRVQRKEQVNDHEAYVLVGLRDNQPTVELYFDKESGLLVRMLHYVETPLGLNPTQIDYGDYREQAGLKTPFRWTIARPSGRFTIQVEQMQQNIPIEDNKFAEPKSTP